MNALDFEILEIEGEWQVWTPDLTGGILGVGKDRDSAIRNAVSNCVLTEITLLAELGKPLLVNPQGAPLLAELGKPLLVNPQGAPKTGNGKQARSGLLNSE